MSYLLRASALIVVDESNRSEIQGGCNSGTWSTGEEAAHEGENALLTLGSLRYRLASLLGGPADGTQVGCEVRRHAL